MSSPPKKEAGVGFRYLLGAALLHVVFLGGFGLTMVSLAREAPPPQLAIQATLVDASSLSRPPPRERPDVRKQQEETRRKEEERREQEKLREQEKQREEEKQREQDKLREAEQQRQEQERLANEQRETEKRLEQERRVEQERREREAKAEAERKRVAEIERKQKEREAEQRRQADAREQQARESDLKRQLEEEEGQAAVVQSGVLDRYRAMLQQHLYRNWNRPASARPGIECEISITQGPRGDVLSAKLGTCNGDASVRQSIENAVVKASPLPLPEDARAFQRNLILQFKPQD